jgi:aldehyde dehydrogenase
MSAVNEALIREVVAEVLGRLGQGGVAAPGSRGQSYGCPSGNGHPSVSGRSGGVGSHGVFADANEACAAAHSGFLQLRKQGVAARARVVEIIKGMADANAVEWAKIELQETKIGRLDHKIEKLQIIKLVPGVEWLHPDGRSGDHGITLEEFTPFGVIAAITPSTHSIPTVSGNIINMVAAGNAVVFNAHPAAANCAAMAVREYNRAIERELGIQNLVTIVEQPTLESFKTISAHEAVRLLCVTGGPAVVKAAMQVGKRAICAGPGNPPVLVDDTACMKRAAAAIIKGAAFDNNLLCIGEKEVFALDSIADELMEQMERAGAARLKPAELDRLTREAFTFKEGQGAGCPEPMVNKALIGKDAPVLAKSAGLNVPEKTDLLFAETNKDHVFVKEEQMMPFLPIVRVRSVEEGIQASLEAEHNYKHTSIIHSHDVEHMTAMARALDTTLFIKNGPCMAGLGLGGEGYLSYSIATPTGEGVTNPRTFTRVRRCVMVDNLRIY